jgi:TRAP-type transport system periplasmic protein
MANGYGFLDFEPAVAYFVERARELSSGGIQIEVVDDWVKDSAPGFEQQIVRDVASGKADLAWVGSRVFDTLGVNSFQALTAPMLIDSYPLQQAVIESAIPGRMLESLDALDVTGLAVLADGLRKPVAVKGPLLGLSDWQGITFASIRSQGQAESIRALGAQATDLWSHPLEQAFDQGEVEGREMSVRGYFAGGLYSFAPYVTANVNLWPQTAVLLANSRRLSGLTDQQRGWLHQAAVDAAATSTSLVQGDAEVLPAACEAGGRFADASEADLAALREAFTPVYAHLEQDPQTQAFIQQIQQLKQSTPAESPLMIPPECTGPAPGGQAQESPDVGPEAAIPDGDYRAALSEEFLLEAGINRVEASTNSGIHTITIVGKQATFADTNSDFVAPCITDVSYSAERVSFYGRDSINCGTASNRLLLSARWTFEKGQLRFHEIQPDDLFDRTLWGGLPWTKIA